MKSIWVSWEAEETSQACAALKEILLKVSKYLDTAVFNSDSDSSWSLTETARLAQRGPVHPLGITRSQITPLQTKYWICHFPALFIVATARNVWEELGSVELPPPKGRRHSAAAETRSGLSAPAPPPVSQIFSLCHKLESSWLPCESDSQKLTWTLQTKLLSHH